MHSTCEMHVSNDVGLTRGSFHLLTVIALCCLFSYAAAATTITPVKVELSRAQPVVTITVTNDADLPLIFQSQVLAWTQVNGEDLLEESSDLLVAPAIVEIAPRGTQVFRITQRRPVAAAMERAYRLVLDDISGTKHQNEVDGVNFVFSHRLPVFVAGTGKNRPKPKLRTCPNTPDVGCVRLENEGDRHVQVQSLVVNGRNWQKNLGAGHRVLAGAWMQWTFPSPPLSAGRLTVIAETSAGRVSFELPNSDPLPTGSVSDEPH